MNHIVVLLKQKSSIFQENGCIYILYIYIYIYIYIIYIYHIYMYSIACSIAWYKYKI